jgi:hypothetical protein
VQETTGTQDPNQQLSALAEAVREIYPNAQFVAGTVDRSTGRISLTQVLDEREAEIGTDASRFNGVCPLLNVLDEAGALYDDGEERIQAELD